MSFNPLTTTKATARASSMNTIAKNGWAVWAEARVERVLGFEKDIMCVCFSTFKEWTGSRIYRSSRARKRATHSLHVSPSNDQTTRHIPNPHASLCALINHPNDNTNKPNPTTCLIVVGPKLAVRKLGAAPLHTLPLTTYSNSATTSHNPKILQAGNLDEEKISPLKNA